MGHQAVRHEGDIRFHLGQVRPNFRTQDISFGVFIRGHRFAERFNQLSAPWRFNSSFKRQVAARGSEIGSNSGFQESKTDGQAEKYGPLPHLQQDQEYPGRRDSGS